MLQRVALRRCLGLSLLSVLICSITVHAGTPEFTGELEYRLHYLTEGKTFASSELGYELSLNGQGSIDSTYHLSFKGKASYRPETRAELALDEAYLDAYLACLDLRVGRQVINWGTADGFNPTNDLNPQDPPSFGEMKLGATPVPAVRAAYYLPSGAAVTGVVVLDYVPGNVPQQLKLPAPEGGPTGNGDQFEFAARGELPVAGFPVFVTYFSGWEDLPAAWLTPTGPDSVKTLAKYRRMQAIGLATAVTWNDAAIWFEGAYKKPEHIDELGTPPSMPLSSNDPYTQLVVGSDYTFSNGLYASTQVVHNQNGSILNPYHAPLQEPQAHTYVVLRQRYSPKDRHTIEMTSLINASDKGFVLAPQYTYNLAEAIQLKLGALAVAGDENSELAGLKPLAQGFTAALKVSF